jgi:hypothetical protein
MKESAERIAKAMTGMECRKMGWINIIIISVFILVSVTATSILLSFSVTSEAMSEMKWNKINLDRKDISNSSVIYYDPNNYNVQYHASYDGSNSSEVKESPKQPANVPGKNTSGTSTPYYHTVSYERLDGYILTSPNILPLTKYDTTYNSPYYDPNNYDVQYHTSYDGSNNSELKESGIWVKNQAGNLEFLRWTDVPKYSTYYKPGAFKYGPSNYVPSYEDTVYFREFSDKNVVQYQK